MTRTVVLILPLGVVAITLAVNLSYAYSQDQRVGLIFALFILVVAAILAILWPNGSPISLGDLRPKTAYRLLGQILIPARGIREEQYLFVIANLKGNDEFVCVGDFPFEGKRAIPALVTCDFRHRPNEKSGYYLSPLE